MAKTESIAVEVAYALPERQALVALTLSAGSRASDALAASGLCAQFPEIDPAGVRLGIFGRAVESSQLLRSGDRVEIYRPLKADPKEVRRRRAAEAAAGRR